MHVSAPVDGEKRPTPQGAHVDVPLTAVAVPAGQGWQKVAPGASE
jgi:hypothetical protein